MVSAAHPLATAAGVSMLEQGGNAADAALAAAFAVSVVEPTMNSIGGRNQILVRTGDGRVLGIDGTTQAPLTYDPDTAPQADYGYPTVGVPGTIRGLFALYDSLATLPLGTIMEPAIRYAEEGFELLPGEARRQQMAAEQIAEFEGSRAHFLKEDGTPYAAGDLFVQPDLAATLRAIRDGGPDVFYEGEIAERMAADIQANGGAVTLESLAQYEAVPAILVHGSYRGYDLTGSYVPAAGATTIQILQALEHFDLASMDEFQWASVVSQAMRLGFAGSYRDAVSGDVDMARAITSPEAAAEIARQIEVPVEAAVPAAAERENPGRRRDRALALAPAEGSDDWISRQHHTTHLSAADGDGMMVALTQTIGPNMGSKVATPGLGFLYAATLGGYLGYVEPGERARSAISPIVVSKDGEPFLVLGAAGGGRIPPAVLQTILRVIDQGMGLDEALAAPRVYGRGEGQVELEMTPGIAWSQEVVDGLEAMGLEVTLQERAGAFGRVHAIQWDAEAGVWVGAADPDWEGSADGPGDAPDN
jgi:gamma-glutamyltranspeptidase/glutathione hydrolase